MYNKPINNNQNRRINKKSATSRHNLQLCTTCYDIISIYK